MSRSVHSPLGRARAGLPRLRARGGLPRLRARGGAGLPLWRVTVGHWFLFWGRSRTLVWDTATKITAAPRKILLVLVVGRGRSRVQRNSGRAAERRSHERVVSECVCVLTEERIKKNESSRSLFVKKCSVETLSSFALISTASRGASHIRKCVVHFPQHAVRRPVFHSRPHHAKKRLGSCRSNCQTAIV